MLACEGVACVLKSESILCGSSFWRSTEELIVLIELGFTVVDGMLWYCV